MRLSGFIPGPTSGAGSANQPTNAVGGMLGVTSGVGAATLGLTGLIVCTANIPDKIAIAVDTQMDDQNAQTGNVHAILEATPNAPLRAIVPATDVYQETGSNQYVVCKTM
jgi:hypothetical protein